MNVTRVLITAHLLKWDVSALTIDLRIPIKNRTSPFLSTKAIFQTPQHPHALADFFQKPNRCRDLNPGCCFVVTGDHMFWVVLLEDLDSDTRYHLIFNLKFWREFKPLLFSNLFLKLHPLFTHGWPRRKTTGKCWESFPTLIVPLNLGSFFP